MKTKVLFFAWSTGILLLSCGSRQEKLERRLENAIRGYLTENLEVGMSIDSVCILHIDSLSDYQYLLFVEKPIAENYAEQLNTRYNRYSEDGDAVEMEQRQEIGNQITEMVNKLERLDNQLEIADSTRLKCWFVASRVYMKKGNQVLDPEYFGFPITPDFRILESEMIPE